MKKHTKTLAIASTTLFGLLSSWASYAHDGHGHCRTRCWYDHHGRRICRTVCYGPGHPQGNGDLASLSSLGALLLSTSAIDNAEQKKVLLVQATEDAAAYLDSGKMTGVLASLVSLSREEAIKEAGAERAASLTDEDLVMGILESAQDLLTPKKQ